MNSFQIENLLAADDKFLGCFPHDMLPPFPKKFPRSLIINTDDSSKPGNHWVGLVLNKNKCYYFDSFGVPILEKNIIHFLNHRYSTAIVNNTCIQDAFSSLCGKFTIAFVAYVKDERQYHKFISVFDPNEPYKNDQKILKIFEKWPKNV